MQIAALLPLNCDVFIAVVILIWGIFAKVLLEEGMGGEGGARTVVSVVLWDNLIFGDHIRHYFLMLFVHNQNY